MRRLALLLMLVSACGGGEKKAGQQLSKQPASVRGWIASIEGATEASYQTVETQMAKRLETFRETTVWVENAPFVSGGVAETGAFLMLDVPPGDVTITFTAPGIPAARLELRNIPGSADIVIPALIINRDGSIAVGRPEDIRVRVGVKSDQERVTQQTMTVAGQNVPVREVPLAKLMDRRDFPTPPGMEQTPVATVK